MDTGRAMELALPFTAYDGEVMCDIILSYGWLAYHYILVNPRKNGMAILGKREVLWVKGVKTPKTQSIKVLQKVPLEAQPLEPEEHRGAQKISLHHWRRNIVLRWPSSLKKERGSQR